MSDFFSRPVVCNTGPILGLSRVGQISVLRRIFPEVLVPREVVDELLANPHEDRTELLREIDSFVVLPPCESPDPLLVAQLDFGEAAVISAAVRRGGFPVVMDERKGRRVATLVYHLEVLGSGGLLVAAKRRGLVSSVGPLLEAMRARGYFLGPTLVAECLRRAGE